MVNSGSYNSDGDRNVEAGFIQLNNSTDCAQSTSPISANSVTLCKNDFSQTADSDLPSVARAIEPIPTKTEFNSSIMSIENNYGGSTLQEREIGLKDDEDVDDNDDDDVDDDDDDDDGGVEERASIYCSVPLDKVKAILSTYKSFKSGDEDDVKVINKSLRKFLCLYCERTFVNVNLRQKHVERCHSTKHNRRVSSRRNQNHLTSTSCIYCDKLTTSEHTLRELFQHLINNHSNKYYGCLPCEDRFLNFSLLTQHNTSCHSSPDTTIISDNSLSIDSSSNIDSGGGGGGVEGNETSRFEESIENGPNQEEVPIKLTRSRMKAKSIDGDIINDKNDKKKSLKELRNKRLAVKSSKIAIKRSKRLQAKVIEPQKKKRTKNADKKEKNVNELVVNAKLNDKTTKHPPPNINPYPEFDSFFRVKKITDHSIDNLKISSLTFDDVVFDKAFYNRIRCNIQENLLHHIDGKLFKNEESESRISNFEKISNTPQELQSTNSENYGCELSLNAVTPAPSLLSSSSQFGEDLESQIEYGSKPSKKKTQTRQDEVHYKYFTRRKYQASILEHKENRDLSKLDMWTQYVIKNRQQKILDTKKTPKEIQDYTSCEEYKNKMKKEELNRILDRRGPFEDLKEEASKKAALEKLNSDIQDNNICEQSFSEVRELLNDLLDRVFVVLNEDVTSLIIVNDNVNQIPVINEEKESTPEIASYLNLRRTSGVPSDCEIDRSDKIALICSSQEAEYFELPTNSVRDKNEKVELTGEWARSRIYVCAACGVKLANMKQLLEHKSVYHQNVWVQHYEFVGNQSELYRHLNIPGLGKVGVLEDTVQCKLWKRSEARLCTKCSKQCNSLGELHRHILECGGDWTWMLARKKCKYRPFGAKSRRKRRGLVKRIYTQKTEPSEKKIYKKPSFEGPRPRPSDAETIERMLANLPPKRATRKIMCLKDGFHNNRNNQQIKSPKNQSKLKCGKLMHRNVNDKKLNNKIDDKPNNQNQNSNFKNNRRSLRSLNKVLASRILDTNSTLMVRRKFKNAKRITRQNKTNTNSIEDKHDNKAISVGSPKTPTPKKRISLKTRQAECDNASRVENEENKPKRTSPRIDKNVDLKEPTTAKTTRKTLTEKMSIKRFFPVKKKAKNMTQFEQKERGAKRKLPETENIDGNKTAAIITSTNSNTTTTAHKKSKKETFSNFVRTLSLRKKKNVDNKKTDNNNVEISKPSTSTDTGIDTTNKLNNKRKLRNSFRKVVKKMKKLKSNVPETAFVVVGDGGDGDGGDAIETDNSKSNFLEEINPKNDPPPPELEKIVIPLTPEKTENTADMPIPVPILVNFNLNDPPFPGTIFDLQTNNEKILQAKGELNFDNDKIDCNCPISIETNTNPKNIPAPISPNKGKFRKSARGLNDCIAMLTSKLTTNVEDSSSIKIDSIFNLMPQQQQQQNPTIIATTEFLDSEEVPYEKQGCILKVPSFKSKEKIDENIALDLSGENQNRTIAVTHTIDKIMSIPPSKENKPTNTIDDIIQRVIDNNCCGNLPENVLIKGTKTQNSVNDIIEDVVFGRDILNKINGQLVQEKSTLRKIGSIRGRKGRKRDQNVSLSVETSTICDNFNSGFLEDSIKPLIDPKGNTELKKIGQRRNVSKNNSKKSKEKVKKIDIKKTRANKSKNNDENKLYLETDLDSLLTVKELPINKICETTEKLESMLQEKQKLHNEDEPLLLENKLFPINEEINKRISDSEDEVPLAALIKNDEMENDKRESLENINEYNKDGNCRLLKNDINSDVAISLEIKEKRKRKSTKCFPIESNGKSPLDVDNLIAGVNIKEPVEAGENGTSLSTTNLTKHVEEITFNVFDFEPDEDESLKLLKNKISDNSNNIYTEKTVHNIENDLQEIEKNLNKPAEGNCKNNKLLDVVDEENWSVIVSSENSVKDHDENVTTSEESSNNMNENLTKIDKLVIKKKRRKLKKNRGSFDVCSETNLSIMENNCESKPVDDHSPVVIPLEESNQEESVFTHQIDCYNNSEIKVNEISDESITKEQIENTVTTKTKNKKKMKYGIDNGQLLDQTKEVLTTECNGEIKENNCQDYDNLNGRRKRNAKSKALEHILDDALSELTESERNREVFTNNNEKSNNDLGKSNSKRIKKSKKVKILDVTTEISSKQNDVNFDHVKSDEDNKNFTIEKTNLNLTEELPEILENKSVDDVYKFEDSNDEKNNNSQELRRSRRNSRKVTSYNEHEFVDPLLDDVVINGRKISSENLDILDKLNIVQSEMIQTNSDIEDEFKPTTTTTTTATATKRNKNRKRSSDNRKQSKENKKENKQLNSDELFDLLKATPSENIVLSKPTNSFLNNFDDVSDDFDDNYDVFENIEKSIAVIEENLADKLILDVNLTEKASSLVTDAECINETKRNDEKIDNINNKADELIISELQSKEKRKRRRSKYKKLDDIETQIDSSLEGNSIVDDKNNGSLIDDLSSLIPESVYVKNSDSQSTSMPDNNIIIKPKTGSKNKKKPIENDKSIYCDICEKSFCRIENLIKHKRTLTHISKLSEIEAREAELKAKLEQENKSTSDVIEIVSESSRNDINLCDILQNETRKSVGEDDEDNNSRLEPPFEVATNNSSLKLADIINDVLNKPVLVRDNGKQNNFSDIIMQNSNDIQQPPEYRRYKSLGERKSFEADNPSPKHDYFEPQISKTAGTILAKQISLLENMIENRSGLNYIDDISVSSSTHSTDSAKQENDTLLYSNTNIIDGSVLIKSTNSNVDFIKPTQYEEISEDSTNLRNYDDQKSRKVLNRDEELFLECCSLLKSGSEVSNYSKKSNHVLKNIELKTVTEPDWLETKSLSGTKDSYSNNSRISTPLGDHFIDEDTNSNSNWNMKGNVFDDVVTRKRRNDDSVSERSFSFEEVSSNDNNERRRKKKSKFNGISKAIKNRFHSFTKKIKRKRSISEESSVSSILENRKKSEDSDDSKKMLTKGAMKVFEGLKVSIPTEDLNLAEVLTRKSDLKKSNNSKFTNKMTRKKPTKKRKQNSPKLSHDIYDFEETQDNSDVFTKPDFRTFRTKQIVRDDGQSDNDECFNFEAHSSTSSISENSMKKTNPEQNITKKKCMIMGRIFKNAAAKSRIDEDIRDIPAIDNEKMVENFVLNCTETDKAPKLSQHELDLVFDKLLKGESVEDKINDIKKPSSVINGKTTTNRRKSKMKNRKRNRLNSDSTDDEFSINKLPKKRVYRKNAKAEDNSINLEQELKECIGVASRKSQRKCTSGKQNVLVEYWSSDESSFETVLEMKPLIINSKVGQVEIEIDDKIDIKTDQTVAVGESLNESVMSKSMEKLISKKIPKKKHSGRTKIDNAMSNENVSNRRKRTAANPLYHWSSSSEDESHDLIEVKPIRDEIEDDDDRPVQHGWIVGDSPKKLVTMLAQAKGKKSDVEGVKELGKKKSIS